MVGALHLALISFLIQLGCSAFCNTATMALCKPVETGLTNPRAWTQPRPKGPPKSPYDDHIAPELTGPKMPLVVGTGRGGARCM